ncbi:MAG: HDIG domain-containing protein, partial [Planctomycetaceae bacterium]|nr:HDIG domain-containing protein [Planctomycetaceae bacterium]
MSFFGTRRPRQTRVFRPTPSLRDKLQAALRDHRVLTQAMIATTAVVLLLLATQAWKTRFPYRAGQFVATGVQARAGFEVVNRVQTDALRKEAADNAPLVLVQDNAVIDRLSSQLRDQLGEIARASTTSQLTQRTRESFGLDSTDALARESMFASIRLPLTTQPDNAGTRIDAMVRQFEELMAEPRQLGLMDLESAKRVLGRETTEEDLELNRERSVMVVDPDGQLVGHCVFGYVWLEQQLSEAGRLAHKWDSLPELTLIRRPVELWLGRTLRNQLRLDPRATERERLTAQENAPAQFDAYPEGTVLIIAGSQLGTTDKRDDLDLIHKEYEEFEQHRTLTQRLTQVASSASLMVMLVLLFGAFLRHSHPELLAEPSRLLTFVLLCAGTVLLSTNMSRDPWRAEIVPLLAAVMIAAIAFNQVVAILTAFCLSLLISMATLADLGHFVVQIVIWVTAIIPLRRIKSRVTLIRTGFLVAIVAFLVTWGAAVVQAQGAVDAWKNTQILILALKFAGWSLICCYLVAGSLPFIENMFGILTDISLLELTAVSHPLLQELARRAPGTYNHSMTVATIAEAAAESIGANGLLTRVGAYFHDIGKMMKPEYFIENMDPSGNPHEDLTPRMSALVIIAHVKDG